jgi:hypothetical protein
VQVEGRTLSVSGRTALRVVAVTGPVGAPFARSDIAQLSAARPDLLVLLGGLGDSHETAAANLSALAALHVPTLFIAGGADRLPVVRSAFEELEENAAEYLMHGSGLRELRVGKQRFALVSGAAQGRYAVDEDGCGFEQDDLDAVAAAFEQVKSDEQLWLLAWNAPSGWGIARGYGGTELGSVELAKLAEELGARGGIFAYPEARSFLPTEVGKGKGLALVVPRLGRTGVLRADGSRFGPALATLIVGARGVVPAP